MYCGNLLQGLCRLSEANILGQRSISSSTLKHVSAGKYSALLEYPNLRLHGPTAEEVLKNQNLKGKTCLITGATSGIGREMARCLSARGCDLIIACRNVYKAKDVANKIFKNYDRHRIYGVDLASLHSVKTSSKEIGDEVKKLDIVILNAAVFGIPWTLTEDGLETILQVNFLSQFYLLMNLESILAPNARVVFLTSESHRRVRFDMDHELGPTEATLSVPEHQYTSIKAYNISKLCALYAVHFLGYRWMYTSKAVFGAHPGTFVKTKLCQNWWVYELLYDVMKPFAKTISQAAATPLYCATSPDLKGTSAIYVKDCKRCEESVLAQDYYTGHKVINLAIDIIRSRVEDAAITHEAKSETTEKSFAL